MDAKRQVGRDVTVEQGYQAMNFRFFVQQLAEFSQCTRRVVPQTPNEKSKVATSSQQRGRILQRPVSRWLSRSCNNFEVTGD
jgi:hypothetical protein